MGIWQQLTSKKISDSPSTEIQAQSNPVHLDKVNKQELLDIVLINEANLRSDGGVIPDMGKIVQTTGDTDREQFRPEKGSVYQFVGGDILATSGTFSVNFEFRDADGNVALMCQSSTTGQEVIFDQNNLPLPIQFTNSLYLYANLTSGEGRISTAFVKIR